MKATSPSPRVDAVLFDLGGVLIEIVGAECMLQWCPALPDLDFHANFPSFSVGRLKPDADYFEHVLDTLGVAPANALFLDDNAINVAAAARLGIVARKAIGPQGVRAVLAELGLASIPAA